MTRSCSSWLVWRRWSADIKAALRLSTTATLESPTQLRCITPANGPLPATGRTAVQVTLNSRDALPSAHLDGVRFAFYNPEHLGPRHLVPDRGGTPAC